MVWEPLAAETLGVRSMSVKYDNIVIDPSASLAPRRFGLPPHPLEWEELVNSVRRILKALDNSDVVIITHYHRDHYNPGWLYDNSVFDNKILIIKDYKRFINVSQKIRAYKFLKQLKEKGIKVRIEIADNSLIEVASHKLQFSPPLPHGDSEKLGYVVAVEIDGKFVFSSDIQGGPLDVHEWLAMSKARTVVIDGPPLYLSGVKVNERHFKLINVLGSRAIVDHHIARIKEWRKYLKIEVKAFNDVLMIPEKLLEAKRKELYEDYPVEDSWLKLSFSQMRSLYFPIG